MGWQIRVGIIISQISMQGRRRRTFSIMDNGEIVCEIMPKKGIHQGDHFSSCLFLISDVLYLKLQKVTSHKILQGVKTKRSRPMLSHLLLSYNLQRKIVLSFTRILCNYCQALGPMVNIQKSRLCSLLMLVIVMRLRSWLVWEWEWE